MPLALLSLFMMVFNCEKIILKIAGFFIEIISSAAKFANELPGSVWYFGQISKMSIIIFLLGFFWICIWHGRIRPYGFIIMMISFILMFNSPKPDLIFDYNLKAIGIKNNHNNLEIYANDMPSFNRTYWANWFGQEDAEIFPMNKNEFTFITEHGKKIIINPKECVSSSVQINTNYNNSCKKGNIILDRDFLKKIGTFIVFCNKIKCWIEYDNNTRFVFK